MTSAMVRILEAADVDSFVDHDRRLRKESGRDGDPITNPRSADEPFDADTRATQIRAGWARELVEPTWTRTWGLFVDGMLRGHLDLKGGRLVSELHRAMLGMGIERVARRKGHGKTMLVTAIAWARAHGLAWIDLGVFAQNAPARALYNSLGFVEIGVHRDRFRVDGVSIDDISMVLALGDPIIAPGTRSSP